MQLPVRVSCRVCALVIAITCVVAFSGAPCRAAAAKAAEPAPKDTFLAFDFGSDKTLAPLQANFGGHGVIFSPDVTFSAGDSPDPVIGDYAAASGLTMANLDKGPYRAAIIAQNAVATADVSSGMVPAKSFSIKANGKAVVDVSVTPKNFFTKDALYYGAGFEDLPTTDFWERYVAPVAPWRYFEFDSDGSLRLEFKECRIYALVVARAEDVSQTEFRKFIDSIQAARKQFFFTNSFKLETTPPDGTLAPSPDERSRGYVVFSRYWGEDVSYCTVPKNGERATALSVSGTPGERVPVTFSVRTLVPLSFVNVSAGDLKAAGGKVMPSAAVSVASVRFKLLRKAGVNYQIAPDVIQPQGDLDIPDQITKTWWLTVTIPPDAAAGRYSGTVTFAPKNAPAAAIPLEVEVYPFTLARGNVSFGMWYADPSQLGYNTGLMGGTALRASSIAPEPPVSPEAAATDREVEAFRVAMLKADMKFISEHGFNGVTVPNPRVKSVSEDGRATLGFSMPDAYPLVLKKYNVNTEFPGQVFLLTIAMQMGDIKVNGEKLKEYTDLQAAAYKDTIAQIRDYWRKAGVNLLAYAVDEPREREINEWNRNLAGTLYYLRLIREVGGWPSVVTTMADSEDGVDYIPILEAEDVVEPHPGIRDVKSVEYARKAGKPIRYFNGSGFKRYPFGFYVWSQKPEGYWQWHYDFWSFAWNPVWEAHVGYTTYPSPDGPLATPGFERAAQGIYDYRYALTLEEAIAKARASRSPAAVAAAEEASAYLDRVRKGCTEWVLDKDWQPLGVPDEQLIQWRSGVVKRILALQTL